MERIISMAVALVITIVAMAQKGEPAINENISGRDNASSNEKETTPVSKKSKTVSIFDVYGEIPVTKPVFEAERYLGSGITGKWDTFIQNYTYRYDVIIGFTDSSVEILKPSTYKTVSKVDKYYKKTLKKEEVSREVATFGMGHILDYTNVMYFDDNSRSFEEALKSTDEPEETTALFNQVTLRKS